MLYLIFLLLCLSRQLDIKRCNYTGKVMNTAVICDFHGNIQCRPSVHLHYRWVKLQGALTDVPYIYIARD